jgi:aminomethyltransferase
MDTSVTPFESNLAWTVAMSDDDRAFVGREALAKQRQSGDAQQLIGLVLEQRGVMRHGQVVHTPAGDGVVTSGTFSPTLGQSIAMARVPAGKWEQVDVSIRNKQMPAKVVAIPFTKR